MPRIYYDTLEEAMNDILRYDEYYDYSQLRTTISTDPPYPWPDSNPDIYVLYNAPWPERNLGAEIID